MNTNHVCPSAPHCSRPLPIRLSPSPVDERVVFVHSVCASLIDSRFGPGRSTQMVISLSEWPELEQAAFCDLTIEGPVPSYSILPDCEVARRVAAAAILDELRRCEWRAFQFALKTRRHQPWDAAHRKCLWDAYRER